MPNPLNPVTADKPIGNTLFVNPQNYPFLDPQVISDLVGWGEGCWLRYQLEWMDIESNVQTPGTYDWSRIDDALAKTTAANLNMVWCIQSPPFWRRILNSQGQGVAATLSGTVSAGLPITVLPVRPLPAGTVLTSGMTLTVNPGSTKMNAAQSENVTISGNYGAGATSITLSSAWTPTYTHSSGTICIDQSGWYALPQDYANIASVAANRYNGLPGSQGYMQAIQIGNEEFDTQGPRDTQAYQLVATVQLAAPQIREVHPTCRIGICSIRKLTGSTALSLQHIINYATYLFTYTPPGSTRQGIGGLFDWGDFHYYRGGSGNPDPAVSIPASGSQMGKYTPDANLETRTILGIFQQYAAQQGFTVPELWCNETGWDTYDDGTCINPPLAVSFTQQANYLAGTLANNGSDGMFELVRKGGATKCMIFTLNSTARVNTLAGCSVATQYSTETKSVTQNSNHVYTYLPAYYAIQAYVQQNIWTYGSSSTPSSQDLSTRTIIQVVNSRQRNLWTRLVLRPAQFTLRDLTLRFVLYTPAANMPPPPDGLASFFSVLPQPVRFGIGTYQPLNSSASTIIGNGFPVAPGQLQNPYAGLYGGSYGYLLDTTIKQPQETSYTPAGEIGLDATGVSVVRGYPQITWVYSEMRPDYWYYLQFLYKQSARTPAGYQYLVLLQYPSNDGTNTPMQVLARMDPPTYSYRTVGAFFGVSLKFTYVNQAMLNPGTLIQTLIPA